MAPVPLFKLAALAIKQIAKPFSQAIKARARNPGIIRNVAYGYGQLSHRLTTRMYMYIEGYKVSRIKGLPEKDAVEAGASALGEVTIYTIGAGLLIAEYATRSPSKEDTEKIELLAAIETLKKQVSDLQGAVNEIAGTSPNSSASPLPNTDTKASVNASSSGSENNSKQARQYNNNDNSNNNSKNNTNNKSNGNDDGKDASAINVALLDAAITNGSNKNSSVEIEQQKSRESWIAQMKSFLGLVNQNVDTIRREQQNK